jgi:hypothetical protein
MSKFFTIGASVKKIKNNVVSGAIVSYNVTRKATTSVLVSTKTAVSDTRKGYNSVK